MPFKLRVGSPAPDFELLALNREPVGLWNCLLEGPLVLEFIRGTWCPSARKRLVELAEARMRFRERWARLLVVVCEDPFTVERYFARHPSPLTVLLDPERRVAKAYGVHQRFGLPRGNIARPASFVIDRAGFIRFSFIARLQIEAASVDTLLAELKKIEAEGPSPGPLRKGRGPAPHSQS
ncbi:MAG: redoxin domain-containing protein [Planctomycetes bacterium]|nr:redoxin domain-containing protein [Planctomycetota bacterium]